MDVTKTVNIHELRAMAKKRLPEIILDFLEGGCDDEDGVLHNRRAMQRYRLVPSYCIDISKRSLNTTIFGQTYAAPFGIAPTGQSSVFRHNAELYFAEAAAQKNIPYVMSPVSGVTLEEAAAKANGNLWQQVYGMKEWSTVEDVVKRAAAAGVKTIVWTVDVPVASNREGLRRNGFMGKMPLRIKLEALTHPGWMMEYFRYGQPVLANYLRYVPNGNPMAALALVMAPNYTWDQVSRLRELWKGQLLVKGILNPTDAAKAIQLGCDGIYVSNHGGRQLNTAPAPFEMLPLMRKAVGDKAEIVVDSGIRRGTDVVLAHCLGASMCFMGRAPNYGVAAGGLKGVLHAIELTRREVETVLGQIGCNSIDELGPHMLFDNVKGEFLV